MNRGEEKREGRERERGEEVGGWGPAKETQ